MASKSRRELEYYTAEKYDAVDGVHHMKLTRSSGMIALWLNKVLKLMKVLNYTFPDGVIIKGSSTQDSPFPIKYEYFQNELKRNIYVTMPNALEAFIDEFEELIGYEPNTEVDDNGVKKTNISIADKFLTKGSGGGIGRQYSSTYTGTGRVATNLSVSGSTGSSGKRCDC